MAAGTVTVRLNLNKDGYSAGMTAARKEAQALEKAVGDAGHGTVSAMQASSAAIRVLEGGITGNIRAAERFIGMLPGVGSALQAAFPLVGGIALAGVFAKIGEEAYKAIKKIEGMSNVVREAFDQMNASAMKNVDAMNLSTEKIREATALLQNKPVNTVALALDEARVKADDLAISLTKDYTAVKKLLDENQNGFFAQMLGKGATADVSGAIQDKFARIATLGDQKREALEPTNEDGSLRKVTDADKARAADLDKQMKAVQKEVVQLTNQQIALRTGRQMYGPDGKMIYGANLGEGSTSYAGANGDQSVNLQLLRGARGVAINQEHEADADTSNSAAVVDQKKAEAQKKAQSEQEKLDKQRYDAMKEAIAKQNAQYGVSNADALAYWSAQINTFKEKTAEFHSIQMETFKLQSDLYKELQEGKKKYLEYSGEATVGNDILDKGAGEFRRIAVEEQKKLNAESAKYNEIVAKGEEISAKNTQSLAEANIGIELNQGTISKLAAAQALVAIHTDEHTAAVAALNEELERQIENINKIDQSEMSDREKEAAIRNLQAERDTKVSAADGSYAVTSAQDAANVQGNTVSGMTSNALNQMVQAWSNMTGNLLSVFSRTMDSLNDDLARELVGQKGHHEKFSRTIGRTFDSASLGIAKAGLQKGEGLLGKMLGFGGDKVSHVIVDNMPGGGMGGSSTSGLHGVAGKAAGWLGKLFGGGGGASGVLSSAQDTSGNLSMLQSLGTMALPMLAGGGDVLAGNPYIVGDGGGPELFVPKQAGRVMPSGSFGGGDTHHYHFGEINAQGSQDPAITKDAVRRAIHESVKQAVSSSVKANREIQRRTPHNQ
jgi:hypothetical protein